MPLTYSRCQMSSNVPFLHPKARPYTSQQPSCRILLQYQPEVPHPLIGMTHGLGLAAQKGTGSPLQAVYFIPICLLLNWGSYKSKATQRCWVKGCSRKPWSTSKSTASCHFDQKSFHGTCASKSFKPCSA